MTKEEYDRIVANRQTRDHITELSYLTGTNKEPKPFKDSIGDYWQVNCENSTYRIYAQENLSFFETIADILKYMRNEDEVRVNRLDLEFEQIKVEFPKEPIL